MEGKGNGKGQNQYLLGGWGWWRVNNGAFAEEIKEKLREGGETFPRSLTKRKPTSPEKPNIFV